MLGTPSAGRDDKGRGAASMRAARGDRSSALHRVEADVVLGERGRRCLRTANVAELRELEPLLESVVNLEAVQHRGHVPGEVLRPPGPPETGGRVALQQRRRAGA